MPRRTAIVRANNLHTVCEEAGCPNIGECWEKKHATFMILGDTCTRACAFCNVKTGMPGALDPREPEHVAEAIAKLGLAHVVVTSVDRDDLADGGAEHFAADHPRDPRALPGTTIEVLTPDFLRKEGALERVVEARPDVFNHNLETVPSLYLTVRPGARYFHSLRLLQRVKEIDPAMFTKSGIMVGLGEERNEVLQVMDDLRSADVDFLTIGQYLQPTRKHHAVIRFVPPDEFEALKTVAYAKGFLMVSSSPLTRSSHHAGEDFAKLRAAREAAPRADRHEPEADGARRCLVHTKRRVRHSAPNMFDLVADVERYPEFVPLCRDLKVRKRDDEGGGRRGAGRRHDRRLQAGARDLPQPRHARSAASCKSWSNISKARSAIWRTAGRSVPTGESACEVEFFIDYEFSSRTLGLLMGAMFDAAFRRFAAAFEKRADEIYGRLATSGCAARAALLRRARAASPSPAAPSAGAPRCGRYRRTGARDGSAGRCARRRRNAPARPACPASRRSGPAMPVIETARSTCAWASAPFAIASAVSRLTAPCCLERRRPARRASAAWLRWYR